MKKRNRIIYWIATVWLALGMVSTGLAQLLQKKAGPGAVDSLMQLGYPIYVLALLGIWKILGAVAVLAPKFPLLKEWAYAGFFFLMSGAIFSHIVVGDPVAAWIPATFLLMLTIISWYFRPLGRRIAIVRN